MGTRTVILTKSGKHEIQTSVFVPDQHGLENISSYQARVISFLNERYGLDGWKDIQVTDASASVIDAIARAERTQKPFGQLDMIRRRARNREKKIDKLYESAQKKQR